MNKAQPPRNSSGIECCACYLSGRSRAAIPERRSCFCGLPLKIWKVVYSISVLPPALASPTPFSCVWTVYFHLAPCSAVQGRQLPVTMVHAGGSHTWPCAEGLVVWWWAGCVAFSDLLRLGVDRQALSRSWIQLEQYRREKKAAARS